jgi:anhydro-N-acetylmuramic acid kinase
MNQNIEKLYQIASKKERIIIGLMSGTSMDGLDVALCRFEGSGGDTKVEVLKFDTVDFDESIKTRIRKVFAKEVVNFQELCLLNPWIGNLHGQIVLDCLEKWGLAIDNVDIIASHGQTVMHAPKILHQIPDYPNGTLQIGDGDHIAVKTGIITFSDFRQKHCAAGGEGAPLAVYGDYLIFSEKDENRILLNMGGISNFTYLAGNLDSNEVFATDTGTGNTLIDAYMQLHFSLPFDKDAAESSKGIMNEALLIALKKNQFFSTPLPKTTGPELFNLGYLSDAIQVSNTKDISHQDILATLSKFTADTIADTLRNFLEDRPAKIYLSGGGMHNPLIMANLHASLPSYEFAKTDVIGINGDAKEAVLFAILANESLVGGSVNFGTRLGVPSVSMGKVSFPS